MKLFKKTIGLALAGLVMFSSCDNDLEEINENQNAPTIVPTYTTFNRSTRRVMDAMRDEWAGGRLTLPWVQYSSQVNYIEEDEYLYRESTATRLWNQLYVSANNFRDIIEKCTDEETSAEMATYGNLENQIAASRIMLSYIFLNLTNHFGDVPYWSYGGRDNTNFQALDVETYLTPVYVTQEEIFTDILNELSEANDQLDTSENVFNSDTNGDKIYEGDAAQWKKFANSLRLRIANQVKDVLPSATTEMQDAVADGVFTSNADNAVQAYGSTSNEANPFWYAFFVDNRTDFAVNGQFMKLLKGESGSYGVDPRLQLMAAPKAATISEVESASYTSSTDLADYIGMPYGLPEDRLSSNNTGTDISYFSSEVLTVNRGETLMEYSEVAFILSEMNGWDQTEYENGIRASMEKWGVESADIDTFIAGVPAASEENVITQKYVALFMQPQEAWAEYRRTGYPNGDILLLPGETGYEIDGTTAYVFTPLVDIDHIPYRVRYPDGESNTNKTNLLAATSLLSNGDTMDSKLWWIP